MKNVKLVFLGNTAQKMKFCINYFCRKCDQFRRKPILQDMIIPSNILPFYCDRME